MDTDLLVILIYFSFMAIVFIVAIVGIFCSDEKAFNFIGGN